MLFFTLSRLFLVCNVDDEVLGSSLEMGLGKIERFESVRVNQKTALVLERVHCPTCGTTNIVKQGKMAEGKQRYECRNPECTRYSFATHYLKSSYDIRTIQDFPGHKDMKMTMIYTHVSNRADKA